MSQVSAEALLNRLLAECVARDASDLHVAPGLRPYFRVHGILEPHQDEPVIDAAMTEALAQALLRGFDASSLESTGAFDGAVSAGGARFRFNVFRCQGQLAVALRRLEDRFRSLSELGMPEALYQLCELPDGLIVVCGPTGAGKSTTLASL